MNLHQMANYNPNLDVSLNQQNKVIHKIQKDLRNFMRAGQGIKGDIIRIDGKTAFHVIQAQTQASNPPNDFVPDFSTIQRNVPNRKNMCVILSFLVPENFHPVQGKVTIVFRQQIDGETSSVVNVSSVVARLNPSTLIDNASTPHFYYYNGGTQLTMDTGDSVMNPNADYKTYVDTLTEVEMGNLHEGMNFVVLQAEIAEGGTNPGTCIAGIVVVGYITFD